MHHLVLWATTVYFLPICVAAPWNGEADPQLSRRDHEVLNITTHMPIPTMFNTCPTTITVYTVVTPSPEASPITITRQNQWITSFQPQLVLCPLAGPDVALRATPTPVKRQLLAPSYIYNTSSVLPGTAVATVCSTIYSPTLTPICHSTLQPLGGLPITITDCTQDITFSTDHGLASGSGNHAGRTELLTTKYHARWSSVTTGVPKATVTADVCRSNGDCTTYLERWGTRALEAVSTRTSTIRVSEVVSGVCCPV